MSKNEKAPGVTDYKRPSWDEYFFEVMKSVAKRSTCERGRSGCVIVKDNQILATGYVGSVVGDDHCDDVGHLFKQTVHEDGKTSNHCVRTSHAEENAICQAAKRGVALEGATLYCQMYPCMVCSRLIAQSGIKKVFAYHKYHTIEDSKRIFKAAGVEVEVYEDIVEPYENQ